MYILSYTSGVTGYGLPDDLDKAMEQAELRCENMQQEANIVHRSTLKVAAEVKFNNIDGYKARKV